MKKFTVTDYKKEVYEEFKDEINLISKAFEKENWQADIGVSIEMFINYIENATENIFVNVPKAKIRIAELKSKITDLV